MAPLPLPTGTATRRTTTTVVVVVVAAWMMILSLAASSCAPPTVSALVPVGTTRRGCGRPSPSTRTRTRLPRRDGDDRRFAPRGRRGSALGVASDVTTTPASETTTAREESDDEPMTTEEEDNVLTFRSRFSRQSDPVAVPMTSSSSSGAASAGTALFDERRLGEFLMDPDHLLAAGTSVGTSLVPEPTDDLLRDWADACERGGAAAPDPDRGRILAVRTAGIDLPGLSIRWSALVGTTLVERPVATTTTTTADAEGGRVGSRRRMELEYVLIRDESDAVGAGPLVWIYDKLSRRRQRKKRERRERRRREEGEGSGDRLDTKLVTRLGLHPHHDDSDDDGSPSSWVIRCDGIMEMRFRVPSVLLRRLPWSSSPSSSSSHRGDGSDDDDDEKEETPKRAAERKVSAMITRQIEKDVAENVARWEEIFRAWTAAEIATGGCGGEASA